MVVPDLYTWSNEIDAPDQIKAMELLFNETYTCELFKSKNLKQFNFINSSAWLRLKQNTKIGLHTHTPHPPHHKLFEGF